MIKDNAVSLCRECPWSPDKPKPQAIPSILPELWLYSFPSWQCSQHPSPSHGPSWHVPMVAVWDGTFPHPFVLPSTRHLSTTRPRAPQGALLQRSFLHRTALPVTPLSLEQSLPLTPGLSIMRQPRRDRAIVGRGTLQAGVLHPP